MRERNPADLARTNGGCSWRVGSTNRRQRSVTQHLAEPSGFDWVDAWMCYAAGRIPQLGRGAAAHLRHLARGAAAGPLTEVEAVRTLAAHGRLKEPEWRHAFARVPPAMSAEMFLTAVSNRSHIPGSRKIWRRRTHQSTT